MSNRSQKRREAREGAEGSSKVPLIVGGVVLVAVAAAAYSLGSTASAEAATEPIEVEGLDDMATLVSMAQGVTMGDPEAPTQIVEFGDYQCPGCGAFAGSVKPMIDLQLVQTGKASFVFYDFPLTNIHPHAFLAARSARCAGDQGKYWEYHSEIFRNQSSWSGQANPIGSFVDYAESVGADADEFEACVNSDAHAAVVTANQRLAYELGVSGTPSVMVSQKGQGMARRIPSGNFNDIQAAVEEIIAAQQAAPESGGS